VFCPEKGSAESAGAVIDLATRGRKRGFCLVMATQRLSKLHKDAAAEMINKLIGRTTLDIDVKRAAEELGFSGREAAAELRKLEKGEFFAYGPALTTSVTRIKTDPVTTTHPKAGSRLLTAPPAPSAKIKSIIAQELQDIPKEAETEARSLSEVQAELSKVRTQLAGAERRAAAAGVPEAEVQRRIKAALASAGPNIQTVETVSPEIRPLLEKALSLLPAPKKTVNNRGAGSINVPVQIHKELAQAVPREGLTAPEQRILDTLAKLESFGLKISDKAMVAAHAGVSPTSGGYFNNLGRLRSAGLVEYPSGGQVALTEAGREKSNPPSATPTLADLHASWLGILPRPQADLLAALIEVYPDAVSKDELADRVGVSRTSGGYFNNLGRLRTLGAIDYPQKSYAKASDILFPKVGK
jgi:Mn-dependent DtxR family transcriptional regulator